MKKLAALVLALCWGLGCTAADAEPAVTAEASTLQNVLNAKRATDSTNDPKWRVSLASALYRYCESVLVQVPRNTPQEDRWVDDEIRDLGDLALKPLDQRIIAPDHSLSWEQRMTRVENSLEFARHYMRKVFSDCSSIARSLTEAKQASPTAEALLWVRLSRLFSVEDEIWRLADIVGLVSKAGCRDLRAADTLVGTLPDVHDKNNLCYSSMIQYSVIGHAVIPLLEAQ
jgi:hypothetical protein